MWACHHLDIYLGIVGHIQEFCKIRMGQVPSILSLCSDENKMKSEMLGINLNDAVLLAVELDAEILTFRPFMI